MESKNSLKIALITGIFAVLTGAVPNIIEYITYGFGTNRIESSVSSVVEDYFEKNKGNFKGDKGDKGLNAKDLPIGTIVAWSPKNGNLRDVLNSGWKVCDGTNGTPDLVGRFLLGSATNAADQLAGGYKGVLSSCSGSPCPQASMTLDSRPPNYSIVYIIKV